MKTLEKQILTSVDEVIASMPSRFHPENCQNFSGIFQWKLDDPFRMFYIYVSNGTFQIHEGLHENPDITVSAKTETYLKLVNGQIKDVIAIVTGKMKVKGSISIAQKLSKIFI